MNCLSCKHQLSWNSIKNLKNKSQTRNQLNCNLTAAAFQMKNDLIIPIYQIKSHMNNSLIIIFSASSWPGIATSPLLSSPLVPLTSAFVFVTKSTPLSPTLSLTSTAACLPIWICRCLGSLANMTLSIFRLSRWSCALSREYLRLPTLYTAKFMHPSPDEPRQMWGRWWQLSPEGSWGCRLAGWLIFVRCWSRKIWKDIFSTKFWRIELAFSCTTLLFPKIIWS